MTRKDLAWCLLVSWACFVLPSPLLAQQPKKKEFISRIEQLEKRIAELEQLEKRVAELERLYKEAKAKTTSQNKLVGNWAVVDEDRKIEGVCTDLKLKDDGTGKAVVNQPDGHWNNVKFDLVGKELQLTDERGNSSYSLNARLKSATDGELVLEFVLGQKTRQVRYTRE